MSAVIALLLGIGVGFGFVLLGAGVRGRVVLPERSATTGASRAVSTARLKTGVSGVVAAFAIYAFTGWVVAAAAAIAAVIAAPSLLGGARRHRREIAEVEAVATWTEQLRDTMAAANGLEHAIAASAAVAPGPIAPAVGRLVARLDYEPMAVALRDFADEVDHPTADFVVAGLVVASEKEARELGPLLGQLAECARAEALMRSRVWAGRARTRTSVRVISAAVVIFALGLIVFDRSYVEPYGSVGGQVMLLVVVGIFAGSLVAMERMGRIELPMRFLARGRAQGSS